MEGFCVINYSRKQKALSFDSTYGMVLFTVKFPQSRKNVIGGSSSQPAAAGLSKEEEFLEKRRHLLEGKMSGKTRARTLMYHVATEADFLEILTDFTIDFLLKVTK